MGSLGFCLRSTSNKDHRIPVAAWISRARLRYLRFHTLRLDQAKSRANPPVWRLTRQRFLDMQPPDPLHDPYTVGTLITIAQAQRSALERSSRPARPVLVVRASPPACLKPFC